VRGSQHLFTPVAVPARGVDERQQDRDRADADRELAQPRRRERVHEHRDDFGVRRRTVEAHEFDAHLRELAGLAAQRGLLAIDVRGVPDPIRAG
jgi:hypothetical protein